jgi:adenylate cyclase
VTGRFKAIIEELRRRRVFKASLIYAITAWIIIQVAATSFPLLNLPEWTVTLVLVLVILGFPLMLILAWVYDSTPHGLVQTPAQPARPIAHSASETPATPAASTAKQPHSIAVLPFVDMSPERDQEHFSDGIAEEILNVLAKLEHLRVAARTSAFAFKGRNEDVRRIGEELGVATVLEGSVRKSGEYLRITAQLINVADGYHLWSDRYDRQIGDVFAIQDEIATSIVDAMNLKIGRSVQLSGSDAAPTDINAYDYYLRGRMYLHRMRRATVRDARAMFEKAIEMDPQYARAYAGVADASCLLYNYWERDEANLAAAELFSKRALELAPNLADARVARGLALSLRKEFDAAAREFEVAIGLDPMSYDAHYLYARSAWAQGDLQTAEKQFKRAAEVRPEDYQALALLASVYRALGKNIEGHITDANAFERIQRHLALNPDDARALYLGANRLIALSERERGIEWLERAMKIDPEDAVTRYNVACSYANLAMDDRAFDALEAAIDLGWAHREWLMNDGDWARHREHPRYLAILDRLA